MARNIEACPMINSSVMIAGLMLVVVLVAVPSPVFCDNSMSPAGTGMDYLAYWIPDWPFVDFFKKSSVMWSQPSSGNPWDDGRQLNIDSATGCPKSLLSGQYAVALMFQDDGGHHPAGNYTCLYDGDGQIAFDMNATVISSAAGRIVVQVQADSSGTGTLLKITQTSTANPIHNIRFIAPGFESTYQTQLFHPTFLQRLQNFRMLRFMDWLNTNGEQGGPLIKEFSDFAPEDYQTMTGPRGCSPIYLIRLCNRLNADLWFNMPCAASDSCIRKVATLIRDSLGPCQKVYFEYANEVWMSSHVGAAYCDSMGKKLGLGTDDWTATIRYWSLRLSQMMTIVESVFAGQMDRVVRVYATQLGNTGVISGLIGENNGVQHCDAVAVAPYFGGSASGSTVDAVIAQAAADTLNVAQWLSGDKAICDQYGFRLISYEGGLDVFSLGQTLRWAVRLDPRMRQIYNGYLRAWKTGGGTTFMQYTYVSPDWGMMAYQDQDTTKAPIYEGTQDFIAANPRWWNEARPVCSNAVAPVGNPRQSRTTAQERRIYSLDGRLIAPHTDGMLKYLAAGAYCLVTVDSRGEVLSARRMLISH